MGQGDLRDVACEQQAEHSRGVFGVDGVNAVGLKVCRNRRIARQDADLADGSPVDAQRGKAKDMAMVGERIEKAVGGGVVCLAGGAEDGTDGREEDEVVEMRFGEGGVEVPCADGLGVHDASEAFGGELDDEAVVEDVGRVEDAAQGRHGACDACEETGYIVLTRNVGFDGEDLHALMAK